MLPEVEQYLSRIEDLRSQISDIVRDLSLEALNWRPIEGEGEMATNSLAVLVAHVAGAEHFWIGEVVGKMPPTRDRDAEFAIVVDSPAEVLEKIDHVHIETRGILSNLSAADLDESRQVRGKAVPVRWGILHVIDHNALHLGHMQLTYQLWNDGRANPSPRWHKRVPDQN